MTLVSSGSHYLRHDGRSFLPVGAHYVPVEGPDWPWRVDASSFDAAFSAMADAGLNTVRIDLLWSAIEPEPDRYDEDHLRVLDDVLEAARRRGVLLHPTLFIGGEVGDAFWDVPWRDGRHPHRDDEMIRLQAVHAAMLAARWREDPAILGWDLTDEPPFWLFGDTTEDADARAWTGAIASAIRREDPGHLITIGTSGQDIGWGPFRADVIAEHLDFTCVHPYPIYQEEFYPDALLSPRMTHAAAFETALAYGAGRPVMVHEYGASSAQFDPEEIARYDRLLSWSSLGRGATGYFAWCWTDAEPEAFARAPYVRQPHETQFGVTDHLGALRPRGRVLSELAATVDRLDLDGLASQGPAAALATIPVPHEYVKPYDTAAYGLSNAPAGMYTPSESVWSPRRGGSADVAPLTRSWLNAFVMASRAGVSVSFERERPDTEWSGVPLLLLPAPLASTTTSLFHLRTSAWNGVERFLSSGGTLYVSCSADVAIPEMERIAGCRIADRAPAEQNAVLAFRQRWGPFEPGDELVIPSLGAALDLHQRGVRLRIAGADVIAVDPHGNPALVVAQRGRGRAVVCAYPLELLLAAVPDAHGPTDRSWGIYAGLANLAGIVPDVEHPQITSGTLLGPQGGLNILTNHGPDGVDVEVRLPNGAEDPRAVTADGVVPLEWSGDRAAVELDAFGSAIVAWNVTP